MAQLPPPLPPEHLAALERAILDAIEAISDSSIEEYAEQRDFYTPSDLQDFAIAVRTMRIQMGLYCPD